MFRGIRESSHLLLWCANSEGVTKESGAVGRLNIFVNLNQLPVGSNDVWEFRWHFYPNYTALFSFSFSLSDSFLGLVAVAELIALFNHIRFQNFFNCLCVAL